MLFCHPGGRRSLDVDLLELRQTHLQHFRVMHAEERNRCRCASHYAWQ